MAVTTEPRIASVSVTIGDQELTFESGKLAKQADGAVLVRAGETMVLSTAQGKMEAREGADFFPLTVDVEERMYAAGKIPGGFFKREGRPTERAILTARVNELTEHLRSHPKDHYSRRGLLKLVGQRRRFLNYLQRENLESYRALIKELGLRR